MAEKKYYFYISGVWENNRRKGFFSAPVISYKPFVIFSLAIEDIKKQIKDEFKANASSVVITFYIEMTKEEFEANFKAEENNEQD